MPLKMELAELPEPHNGKQPKAEPPKPSSPPKGKLPKGDALQAGEKLLLPGHRYSRRDREIMAGIATYDMYDPYNSFLDSSDKDNYDPAKSSLHEIFPRDGHSIFNETDQKWYWEGDEEFWGKGGWTASKQAGRQFAAMVITMAFAVVGGLATGLLMKWIAKSQASYKKGATVAHLALNISNVMSYHAHPANLPKEMLFDDNAFFYQEESDDEEDYYKHITPTVPGQKNGTTSVPLEERNGGINNKAYS